MLLSGAAFLAASMAAAVWSDTREDFDRAAWRAAGAGDLPTFTTRGRMSDDLVARHLRVGMSRSQVLALLGEPDQPSTTEVVYYLGASNSLLSTLSFLVLSFEGDRLVRIRLADD